MSPDIVVRDGELVFGLLKGETHEKYSSDHLRTDVANNYLHSLNGISVRFPKELKSKALDSLSSFLPRDKANKFLKAAIEKREGSKLTFTGKSDPETNVYTNVVLKIAKNNPSKPKVLK